MKHCLQSNYFIFLLHFRQDFHYKLSFIFTVEKLLFHQQHVFSRLNFKFWGHWNNGFWKRSSYYRHTVWRAHLWWVLVHWSISSLPPPHCCSRSCSCSLLQIFCSETCFCSNNFLSSHQSLLSSCGQVWSAALIPRNPFSWKTFQKPEIISKIISISFTCRLCFKSLDFWEIS